MCTGAHVRAFASAACACGRALAPCKYKRIPSRARGRVCLRALAPAYVHARVRAGVWLHKVPRARVPSIVGVSRFGARAASGSTI
eukprot:7606955-Alexandrium_andersonii.AAC.1